jgi:hypothetical protein
MAVATILSYVWFYGNLTIWVPFTAWLMFIAVLIPRFFSASEETEKILD